MPAEIIPAVEAASQSKGTTLSVLRRLAYRHNTLYGYAYPSHEDIADYLRVSVRTVQRHIAKLEQMGEIIVHRVHGRGLNNRYFLKLLGIVPKPGKHDTPSRWSRLKDSINQAFAGKHDNLAANKQYINDISHTPRSSASFQQAKPIVSAQSLPERPEIFSPFWCAIHQYCHSDPLPRYCR
jgi:biotin operon repressor